MENADPGDRVAIAVRRGLRSALAVYADDEVWARQHAQLILEVLALRAYAHTTFDGWRGVAGELTTRRVGMDAADLVAVIVGNVVLAASLPAHQQWVGYSGTGLATFLSRTLELPVPDV